MIFRLPKLPPLLRMLGVTFTSRPLTEEEIRVSEIYTEQWRELFWLGYPLVWLGHYLWIFLLTLDDKKAIRLNPFIRERVYFRDCLEDRRYKFGWVNFLDDY